MNLKGKKASKSKSSTNPAAISEKVGNYEKHPFFIKKAKDAKDFLLKVGLPKQLTKKAHA